MNASPPSFEVFAAALLDPTHPTPPGLCAWNGSDPGPRLDVHRNNVVASLVAALADTLPVLRRWLGDEAFAAMARGFLNDHPPRSPVLAEWGDELPGWLAQVEAAERMPWLADLARLERARVQAFHAADATPMALAPLQAALADAETLPFARLRLHPACRLVISAFGVVSLWRASQHDRAAAAVNLDQPEAALVMRDASADDAVVVVPLPLPTARWIVALTEGRPLGEAVAAADGVELAPALALLLRRGAVVDWETCPQTRPPGKENAA